jgi:hypothetical protein
MLAHSSAAPCCSTRPAARLPHHAHILPARLQQQLRTPVLRQQTLCSASNTGSSSSTSSFAEQAQRFADSAQQKMQDFVKEQKLDEKAAEAGKEAKQRVKTMAEEAQQNMRRTYMKLESEHNISQRFERTKTWASETVRDIDQEWSVRRKLKSVAEDVQRKLPLWRRQFSQFSSTPLGKAALTLGFVSLLFSGLFWQLVNAFWLLFWLSIPVSALIASQRSKEAGQEQQQQQQQRAQSPFSGWGSSSTSSSRSNSEGPIVEAEWVSLDEDDQPKSGWKRR